MEIVALGRTWAHREGSVSRVHVQVVDLSSKGLIEPPVHICGLLGPGGW